MRWLKISAGEYRWGNVTISKNDVPHDVMPWEMTCGEASAVYAWTKSALQSFAEALLEEFPK